MARRTYRQSRRGEAAEETRRRIVEATFALHNEQGIAATTMKQIAERAGVAVGSVYHHFPTYDDAIGGCASHVRAAFPFPAAEAIERGNDVAARVEAYVDAYAANADVFPGAEAARSEAHVSRHVASFFEEEAAHRLALACLALGVSEPTEEARALAALADFAVFNAFAREGLPPEVAARTLKSLLTGWLAPKDPR
ncbi:MAG TPA: TetR family transcriptional regulator [Caulobacteraceae bacterium]|nr:TetR family transcriptional regulator [Caulobacteraceae bacterium]